MTVMCVVMARTLGYENSGVSEMPKEIEQIANPIVVILHFDGAIVV